MAAEICMDGERRMSLMDIVFSWSLDDVMNKDLFRQEVSAFSSQFFLEISNFQFLLISSLDFIKSICINR